MAISVTHPYISPKSNLGGTDKVQPSNWNAAHALNGFGTGVESALGKNIGSVGAPVVQGGVLGTPFSGDLSNCTGLPAGTGLDPAGAWSSVVTYAEGALVTNNENAYISLQAGNLNNAPSGDETDTAYWMWLPSLGGGASLDGVHVRDFGAVGDNFTDDTMAIQAAIDYAFANNIKCVYMDGKRYKITSPIYLDSPDNLRVDWEDPDYFQFNMALIGVPGGVADERVWGTSLQLHNDIADEFSAIIVGPGQSMTVMNIHALSTQLTHRGFRNLNESIGISIPGSRGGSRTLFVNVTMVGFAIAFATGTNGNNNLCDSHTFFKCWARDCRIAWHFGQTQNFINSLYDCQCQNAVVGVKADVGTGAHVFGGNWSTFAETTSFTISDVGEFVDTGTFDHYICEFQCHIDNPDGIADEFVGWFEAGIYDAFCLVTENFGVLAAKKTAYDPDTQVATFRIFMDSDDQTFARTDLESDLTALTKIYASEMQTMFWGSNLHINGVHIENPEGNTRLFYSEAGFGSNRPNTLTNSYANTDASFFTSSPVFNPLVTDEQYSQFLHGGHWPYIEVGNNDLLIENCCLGIEDTSPCLVRVNATGGRFITRHVEKFYVNIQYLGEGWTNTGSPHDNNYGSRYWGFGEYDVWPFNPRYMNLTSSPMSWQKSPYEGFRPALSCVPAVASLAFESAFNMTEDPLSDSKCGYAMLWGRRPYQIVDSVIRYTGGRNAHAPFTTVINGRNGTGAVTLTGASRGGLSVACLDYVDAVINLTDQTDATADFERWITVNNQVQQLSASDLSAKKFMITVKTLTFVQSNHDFYSYGVDITDDISDGLSWHIKGRSHNLYFASVAQLEMFFPGLQIIIPDEDDADQLYICYAVHPLDGYIKIAATLPLPLNGFGETYHGGATFTQTGTLIKQQPYDFIPV